MTSTKRYIPSLLLLLLIVNYAQAFSVRMIGGDVSSKEDQFPYVVYVKSSDGPYCTGSIIDKRFVVTAAHCITSFGLFGSNKIQIKAGVRDFNSEHGVVDDVVEAFVPIDYHVGDSVNGDIAVLKLKEDLDIENNPKLGKLNLPTRNITYVGAKATVAGFGWNEITIAVTYPDIPGLESLDGNSDGKMRHAEAKVVDNAECARLYKQGEPKKDITWKVICAQMKQRNSERVEGICAGDSGGPLVYKGTLIGVVNTSPLTCREDEKPAVYARVTEYVDFINKAMDGSIDETIRSHTL